MLKATMATDRGSIVVLGLSRENTRRLLAGQPIEVVLHDLDPRLPVGVTVLLMGGETEAQIERELRTSVQRGRYGRRGSS